MHLFFRGDGNSGYSDLRTAQPPRHSGDGPSILANSSAVTCTTSAFDVPLGIHALLVAERGGIVVYCTKREPTKRASQGCLSCRCAGLCAPLALGDRARKVIADLALHPDVVHHIAFTVP